MKIRNRKLKKMINSSILRYFGKAKKNLDGEYEYHLLVYHCLDVAAVAEAYLNSRKDICNFFTKKFGFQNTASFINYFLFLMALHDLGKFSISFQDILPEIWINYPDLKPTEGFKKYHYKNKHDSLGFKLWKKNLKSKIKKETSIKIPQVWIGLITGHHGVPPHDDAAVQDFFHEKDINAAWAWVSFINQLFLSKTEFLADFEFEKFNQLSKTLSWWLAGIVVLSDWLGSDSKTFKFSSIPIDPINYWNKTRITAKEAINNAGLKLAIPSKLKTFKEYFNFEPTPLQTATSNIEISSDPQLFILEDVTGSGKTEAAIQLAHRLISNENANGLYLGLPTKATANAMYGRMSTYYHQLFTTEEKPSLMLAHGSKKMNKKFCKSLLEKQNEAETELGHGESNASAYCNDWFADNNKKALLAEIGIGTLDQVLLGVLPLKHQSLRLLGLFGKLLIVDEVHSYDPYMNELLCNLIRFQTAIGGSTILMSATIPNKIKQDLINAFQEESDIKNEINSNDFPLLTQVHLYDEAIIEKEVSTRKEVERIVIIEQIHQETEVYELIKTQMKEGKCVCWIRNSVFDVQRAYDKINGEYVNLENMQHPVFHARFCLGDRLDIEDNVIELFGERSNSNQRNGRLLIASQVIEQSLDVDFDVLITDLAPMDSIIQRAGRLQRHIRDLTGTRKRGVSDKDERTPVLYIYGPDPVEDPPSDWYEKYFEKAKWVYRNDNQLWLTAKKLKEKGQWKMPDDARELIEYVYGGSMFDIQPNLMERTLAEEGENLAGRNMAENYELKLSLGYLENSNWDEPNILSRLGLDSIIVFLCKWENSQLSKWYQNDKWEYSSINISKSMIPIQFRHNSESIQKEIEILRDGFIPKNALFLAFERNDDKWIADISSNDKNKQFIYDVKFGFREIK